jgi:hypothetical protein
MANLKQTVEIQRRGTTHSLVWSVKNLMAKPVGLNPGILLYNKNLPYIHTMFKPLSFTTKLWIDSGREVQLMKDDLVVDKIDNWRFYFHAYSAVGLETTMSQISLLTDVNFIKLKKQMDQLAKEYGLPDDIDPGLFLELDKRNEQIKEIMSGQPASNGLPQIISIIMEEGFHDKDEDGFDKRDMQDIEIVDLRKNS